VAQAVMRGGRMVRRVARSLGAGDVLTRSRSAAQLSVVG